MGLRVRECRNGSDGKGYGMGDGKRDEEGDGVRLDRA